MPKNPLGHLRGRPKRHLFALISILVLGTLLTLYSLSYSLGSLETPGPGLWPTVGGVIMVLGSIALLLGERESDDYEKYTAGASNILVALGLLIGTGVLFSHIGLTIPMFILLVAWIKILGRESWTLSLTVGVIGSAAIYIAFDILLGIPFPRDILVENIGF